MTTHSPRITLGTYALRREGDPPGYRLFNSFNEGEYTRGGLREALEDARAALPNDGRRPPGYDREECGICVAVFPLELGGRTRIVACFPWCEGCAHCDGEGCDSCSETLRRREAIPQVLAMMAENGITMADLEGWVG